MGVAIFLERAIPGAKASIRGHIERGERIARAIKDRFGVGEPRQWRAKHLRWALERWTNGLSASSRYDYWRTARAMASALGHWPDWEPHLRGPWQRQGRGGRPAKLARAGTRVPGTSPDRDSVRS
ncbi:hypothetical protein B4966_15105 [Rhodocyclaceae bacterium]|nr:hypothetical protein B4966_15105 [Rhodocyclaceae bacterium]